MKMVITEKHRFEVFDSRYDHPKFVRNILPMITLEQGDLVSTSDVVPYDLSMDDNNT